jgi:hypothetical protein
LRQPESRSLRESRLRAIRTDCHHPSSRDSTGADDARIRHIILSKREKENLPEPAQTAQRERGDVLYVRQHEGLTFGRLPGTYDPPPPYTLCGPEPSPAAPQTGQPAQRVAAAPAADRGTSDASSRSPSRGRLVGGRRWRGARCAAGRLLRGFESHGYSARRSCLPSD